MSDIIQEYISNCVREDIEEYYTLHTQTDDTIELIDHCLIMTDQLYQAYNITIRL